MIDLAYIIYLTKFQTLSEFPELENLIYVMPLLYRHGFYTVKSPRVLHTIYSDSPCNTGWVGQWCLGVAYLFLRILYSTRVLVIQCA